MRMHGLRGIIVGAGEASVFFDVANRRAAAVLATRVIAATLA